MEITVDRMKHSLAVARKMKDIVMQNPKEYDCSPDDAFVLGMLHDIGYEFVAEQKEHANKGGLVLKEQGYRYWREVYYHGIPQEEYTSSLLELLNYADLTTGPSGESMTVQQRIDDIIIRYGRESEQVIDAIKLSLINRLNC